MARPRCPVCRSKRWHRDSQSGLVVCEEGHILQGYVQEDNEADGPSQHATTRRKLRKNKQRKARKTADPDCPFATCWAIAACKLRPNFVAVFHGPQLRFLFFQCAQLILRKQIAAIVKIWDLPPELETIASDLWAMYVTLSPIDAEPFRDTQAEPAIAGGPSEPSPDETVTADDPVQKLYEDLSDSGDEVFSKINAEIPGDEPENSDQEGDSHVDDADAVKKRHTQTRSTGSAFDPTRKLRLHYTLVICYLSCLTLRVPVTMKDILSLAETYDIEYLDAMSAIPADMKKHLDPVKTEMEFLRSHVMPIMASGSRHQDPDFAHLVTIFARMYHKHYRIDFPDINAAPVLWKTVRDLGLPPFFYITSRRLLMALHSSMGLEYRTQSRIRSFPDLQLAASIIISAKLLWGLDGTPRIAQDNKDMAAALPRAGEWLDFAEKLLIKLPPGGLPQAAMSQDVPSLSLEDIDIFLDFCDDKLVDQKVEGHTVLGTLPVPGGSAKVLDRFFPRNSQTHDEHAADDTRKRMRLNSVQAEKEAMITAFYKSVSFPLPGEASSEEPLFPGQSYKIYESSDRDGGLHRDLERVYLLISTITGIDKFALELAVRQMENKLHGMDKPGSGSTLPKEWIPWEGLEARMFGEVRARGGSAPWPQTLSRNAKPEQQEKRKPVLVPRLRS